MTDSSAPGSGGGSAAVRAQLPHPVIDADGHWIEFLPLVRDFLREEGGADLVRDFDGIAAAMSAPPALSLEERRAQGLFQMTWWAYPAEGTVDRATGMLPGLLYDRLDELGIDFAVLYPTLGMTALVIEAEELRGALVRAFNRCAVELFAPYSDRITPVAMVPMHSPGEAIDALEHARGELGAKAILMNGLVLRPLGPDLPRGARWVDAFGAESPYDYDPVWARCVELGVAPAFHSSAMGWGSRVSQSNYVHNHIGNFAQAGEATCRSLVMDGVPMRHPALRCAFLEGGVGWACALYADLVGHYEKRGPAGLHAYDPERIDRAQLRRLVEAHGSERFRKHLDELEEGLHVLSRPGDGRDDFERSGIGCAEDLKTIFERSFRFGCEADDPLNALAFDARYHPLEATLPALFSSDIGHWDVREMRGVVEEAWELVDRGLIDEAQFRRFVFEHAATLYAEADPEFFGGTRVAAAVASLSG